MEVGHHAIHGPETIAGCDEDRGRLGERLDPVVVVGGRLQQPQAGGADTDDAPALRPRRVQGFRDLGGNLAEFGVHAMVRDRLALDRQEGAGAHVQSDEVDRHAPRDQSLHQVRGEMQPRRRRGDGPRLARIDRLVVRFVAVVLGPATGDVGRQGHDADAGDGAVEIVAADIERQRHLPALRLAFDDRA